MTTLDKPAIMNFDVPPAMRPFTRTYTELPEKFSTRRIKGTEVTYTEGPFGAFFKQEVISEDWVVGWLDFVIEKPVDLFPITRDPLLALYIGLEGNIPCDLQGTDAKLMLPEKRLGFYYVPPNGFNCAQFEVKHYTALYISFTHSFVKNFRDKYKPFQQLLDVPLKQFHQYQEAMKAAAVPNREDIERYEEFGDMVEKQGNQEAAGKQGLLLPLGSEHKAIIKQMAGYDQNLSWLTSYLYGQIWLMIVNYFNQMTARAALPQKVLDAVDYIETNYAKPKKGQAITPKDVVTHLGTNARELNRLFKETFGRHMRDYLTDVRFAEARFRLRKTDAKLATIAEETGLAGASHLTKLIREEFKMTPKEYRERYRES
jgi:AraC-like DNA-binding protein